MAVIEAIETIYLEAAASSVTFSGIPSTYEHLQVRFSVTEEHSAASRSNVTVFLNSDTGANYSFYWITGITSAASVGKGASVDTPVMYSCSGGDQATAGYAGSVVDILDYANTNKNTTVLWISGWGPLNDNGQAGMGGVLWDDTAAVTSIQLADSPWSAIDFQRGSEFTLYGLNSS